MIVHLLAHQGGWDEILLVVGPILVIVALVNIGRRRADAAPTRWDDDDLIDDER